MKERFISKVKACLELAERLYDLDLSKVRINITDKAHTARAHDSMILEFNDRLVQYHYNRMVTIAIPHEVAHLVCYELPHLGCGHDVGYREVLRNLNYHWSLCY